MRRLLISYLLVLSYFATTAQTRLIEPNHQYWKEIVFYQIYMPSFRDSDGNGYSDFKE